MLLKYRGVFGFLRWGIKGTTVKAPDCGNQKVEVTNFFLSDWKISYIELYKVMKNDSSKS